jgi:hypothetical protein
MVRAIGAAAGAELENVMPHRLFAAALCAAMLASPALAQEAPEAPAPADARMSTQTAPLATLGLGGISAGALATIGIVGVALGVAASNTGDGDGDGDGTLGTIGTN